MSPIRPILVPFVFLLSLTLLLDAQQSNHQTPRSIPAAHRPPGYFLNLRAEYEDLLGKGVDVAVERFGPPDKDGKPYAWTGNAKTHMRTVVLLVDGGKVIRGVKVSILPNERLDPMDLLKRAQMFDFESGTYANSLTNFLMITTKDGKNGFQFEVSEAGVTLDWMLFNQISLRR